MFGVQKKRIVVSAGILISAFLVVFIPSTMVSCGSGEVVNPNNDQALADSLKSATNTLLLDENEITLLLDSTIGTGSSSVAISSSLESSSSEGSSSGGSSGNVTSSSAVSSGASSSEGTSSSPLSSSDSPTSSSGGISSSGTSSGTSSSLSSSSSVPVSYSLTLGEGGSGAGSYIAGTEVVVTAPDSTASQKCFVEWDPPESWFVTGSDKYSRTATLIMPAQNWQLTWQYTTCQYVIQIINGTGSDTVAAGRTISISADEINQAGDCFKNWSGNTEVLSSSTQRSQSFTSVSYDVTLTAEYETCPVSSSSDVSSSSSDISSSSVTTYTLTLTDGKISGGTYNDSSTGEFNANDVITIQAVDKNAQSLAFSEWTWSPSGLSLEISSTQSNSTTLIMPAADVTIVANYVSTGSGYYNFSINGMNCNTANALDSLDCAAPTDADPAKVLSGATVWIGARAPEGGECFSWTGDAGALSINASSHIPQSFSMPTRNIALTTDYSCP